MGHGEFNINEQILRSSQFLSCNMDVIAKKHKTYFTKNIFTDHRAAAICCRNAELLKLIAGAQIQSCCGVNL